MHEKQGIIAPGITPVAYPDGEKAAASIEENAATRLQDVAATEQRRLNAKKKIDKD